MRINLILSALLFMSITPLLAQQSGDPYPNRNRSVQDITRIVPELLPQAIRDSISNDPTDRKAEVTSAEEISKQGKLIYKVTFLKNNETWSKSYDENGRHIDEGKKEESLFQTSF